MLRNIDVDVSSLPGVVALGINDQSRRQKQHVPSTLPSFSVLVIGYAEKGGSEPMPISGIAGRDYFGDSTFDENSKYATHQTKVSNILSKNNTRHLYKRIIPQDAKKAGTRLVVDLIETQIPVYEREENGTFKRDEAGKRIPSNTAVHGYKVNFRLSPLTRIGDGFIPKFIPDQTVGEYISLKSYALMDFESPFEGEFGNNSGFRIFTGTTKDARFPIDRRYVTEGKTFPFWFSQLKRNKGTHTAKVHKTIAGLNTIQIALNENAQDPLTKDPSYVGDRAIRAYEDLYSSYNELPINGELGNLYVYDENIKTVLDLLYKEEKSIIGKYRNNDIVDTAIETPEDSYIFNLFGLHDTRGVPYTSSVFLETSLHFTPDSSFWLEGGKDGTMSYKLYEEAVRDYMELYNDIDSPVIQPARNDEKWFADTGFGMETKKEIAKFISIRKDTAIMFTNCIFGENNINIEQRASISKTILQYSKIYSESNFFGTDTCRAAIIDGEGSLISSLRTGKVKKEPLIYDVIDKLSKYCGLSNGKWNSSYAIDVYPNNKITDYTDIDVAAAPQSIRLQNWTNGVSSPIHETRKGCIWAALRSVYQDETSILISLLTIMACVDLQRYGTQVFNEVVGAAGMSENLFKDNVERIANRMIEGKFDNKFKVVPVCIITEADRRNGYAFDLAFDLYGYTIRTVQRLYVNTLRSEG